MRDECQYIQQDSPEKQAKDQKTQCQRGAWPLTVKTELKTRNQEGMDLYNKEQRGKRGVILCFKLTVRWYTVTQLAHRTQTERTLLRCMLSRKEGRRGC